MSWLIDPHTDFMAQVAEYARIFNNRGYKLIPEGRDYSLPYSVTGLITTITIEELEEDKQSLMVVARKIELD